MDFLFGYKKKRYKLECKSSHNMKKSTLAFIFFLSITSINLFAQETKEVETLVEKLRKAMLDGNQEVLQSITSKDLTYGHSSGVLENQTEFIEALTSGKSDFTKIETVNQTVKIVGLNALVRHELHGTVNGHDVNLGVLLVWVKEGKTWKLLARQAFKL
jgi:hypothetical protein